MQIIKPSVELIEDKSPYRLVERIGRTCYKSEDKITDSSCYDFVNGLAGRKHFAMLEHARFLFVMDKPPIKQLLNTPAVYVVPTLLDDISGHSDTYFVSVSMSHLYNSDTWAASGLFSRMYQMIQYDYIDKFHSPEWNLVDLKNENSGFIAPFAESVLEYAIQENGVGPYQDLIFHTVKFICDRGVSHELVRHRVSVAQESTRYCNYTKDKFGGEITFVEPADYAKWNANQKDVFEQLLAHSETVYNYLINTEGKTPQQARAVLPNALKTEVILTMNEHQWMHFLDLRSRGTTGAPHPDMKVVADIAQQLLNL